MGFRVQRLGFRDDRVEGHVLASRIYLLHATCARRYHPSKHDYVSQRALFPFLWSFRFHMGSSLN